MNACACMGKIGNDPYCPCEMNRKGLKVSITESWISPELFDLLSDEDKNTINDLKFKAVTMALCKQNVSND